MRVVAAAFLVVAIGASTTASPARAASFVPAGYFPLEPGIVWTYRNEGLTTASVTVLPDLETVGGVPTRVLESTGPGVIGGLQYLTNDDDGLRLHGGVVTGFLDGSLTLSPPLVVSPASASFGQLTLGGGSASLEIPGLGTFPLGYDARSTVVGAELVTVPAGTFETVKVEFVLQVSGTVLGQQLPPLNVTETDWYAAGIGPVRIQLTAPLNVNVNVNVNVPAAAAALSVSTWELVSFVPEPEHAMITGLAAVVALAAGRRLRGAWEARGSGTDPAGAPRSVGPEGARRRTPRPLG
jgi:hypothetical protein